MRALYTMLVLAACGGGDKDKPAAEAPGKLSKLEARVSVDGQGRIRPTFRLVDQKLNPVAVTGTYSVAIARADGSALCRLDGTFTPADFSESRTFNATYRDAGCPAEPGAEGLKISIRVVSPDKTIERTLDLPAARVYESLPTRAPAGSGSAGSAGSGSAGSGSAGSGSAGAAVEAPDAPAAR